MKPHKHAELIKEWADGAVIERLWNGTHEKAWLIDNEPDWNEFDEYRIKPDVVRYFWVEQRVALNENNVTNNLKLTFDGETGELKSAEVLK